MAAYLQPCSVDDSDLEVDYQVVRGWMPFDSGGYWGDLEATRVLTTYLRAWRDDRVLHRYESGSLSKDFKCLDWAPERITDRLEKMTTECLRLQNQMFRIWESIEENPMAKGTEEA